ncbi:hypothetical protein [Halosimplex amylolyticum]|uniref:hypothetical protein n=1 Tax=Halosimplex amylolyticum TaxID=3396616 RepID=UPI003F559C4D
MRAAVSIPIFLIGVFVAAATLAPVGTAAPTAADGDALPLNPDSSPALERPGSAASDAAGPETEVTVRRTAGGAVAYDVRVTDRTDSDRLWIVLRGPATVLSAPGFDRTTDDGTTRLVWTGESSEEIALTVAVPDAATAGDERAATADWAFGPVPFVELQWAADGSVGRSWPLAERRAPDAGTAAVLGDRYAVVGESDTTRRTTPNGRIDLVVPSGVMSDARADRVADALVQAERNLDVGDRGDDVLAFAAPESVRWGGESVPVRDEFWVNAGSRLDDAEAVWLHEYVHTRQSFVLADDMAWFREASAEYYAASLAREQGLVDRAAMERHLDGDPSTATLTDPDSWAGETVPQRKGGRALAVLDRRIRERTYGHRSLDDVFRRLNRHDGVVTYAVFAQAVAEVTGEPHDDWLDRHVNGSAPVADQYGPDARPLGAALLGGFGLGDAPTEPGVGAGGIFATVRGAGVAFFSIATGFSVVAAVPLYGALRRLQRRERREPERGLDHAVRAR